MTVKTASVLTADDLCKSLHYIVGRFEERNGYEPHKIILSERAYNVLKKPYEKIMEVVPETLFGLPIERRDLPDDEIARIE